MEEVKKRNARRTKEEIVAEIDSKINHHKECIATLEAKKQAVLNPKPRKKVNTMKNVLDKAKANGMKPEEVAKLLGISLDD